MPCIFTFTANRYFSQDQYYHHSTNIYWKYSDEGCHMHIKVILCIIIRLTHVNVWESMGKPCSCMQFIKTRIFTASHARIRISTTSHMRIHIKYCKSRENPYQVLQVTCPAASERAMKSKVRMIKSYQKNITRLLPLALLLVLCTRNNTDVNKLVVFSGIASYYNYMLSYV